MTAVVRAVLYLDRRATYAEYLATEQASEARHEYIDGVIVAMAGGSDEHNAIASRFGGLCMLLSGDCRHYTADQRFFGSRPRDAAVTAMDGSSAANPPILRAMDRRPRIPSW